MAKRPHLQVLLYEALVDNFQGGPASKKDLVAAVQARCRICHWKEPNGDNLSVRLREMARDGCIRKFARKIDGKPARHIEYEGLFHPDKVKEPVAAGAVEGRQTRLL